jgi:hypothetical protein
LLPIGERTLGKELESDLSGYPLGRKVLAAAKEKVSELFGELLENG